jgi:hypothetical protein
MLAEKIIVVHHEKVVVLDDKQKGLPQGESASLMANRYF